jgi:hypothetical protein
LHRRGQKARQSRRLAGGARLASLR